MNTIKASTLRPGLLVSLKTSVTGNVSYARRDIETDHLNEDGSRKAIWETERHIQDAAEHADALKVQGKVSTLIRGVCAKSAFGLLCPEKDADKLDAAISEARELANAFNASATLSRISVYVIAGRIAADDVEAVRAINSEVRELLSEMEAGLGELDVKRVRDAADKARQLGTMLDPVVANRVQVAIDAARTMARKIVKAGETLSVEIDTSTLQTLKEARTAFLDLDEPAAPIQPSTATGRALDLETQAAPMPGIMPLVPRFEV